MKDNDVNAVIMQLRAGYSTPELEKQLKEGDISKIGFANILMSRAQQSNNQVQYEQSLFENNHQGIMQQYNLLDEPQGLVKFNKNLREIKRIVNDPWIRNIMMVVGLGVVYKFYTLKNPALGAVSDVVEGAESNSIVIRDKHVDMVAKALQSLPMDSLMSHIRELEASVKKNPSNNYNRAFYNYFVDKVRGKMNAENDINKLDNEENKEDGKEDK